jgi:putative ABC transport system permease protein
MVSDFRCALRQISKAPGFTAVIVLTLALAIGACTAIYSALDRIVLNPYDDPATKRNVVLRSIKLSERLDGGLSLPDYFDLEQQATSFEFMAYHAGGEVNVIANDEALRLNRRRVTQHYFNLLGIPLAVGRGFMPEEFVDGKDNVVVISYGCWQRTFGGVPDILGRTLQIQERSHTVIGVISERFDRTGSFDNLWTPRTVDVPPSPNARDIRGTRGGGQMTVARLRRGVSMKAAQSELDVIASALAQRYPDTNKDFGMLAATRMPAQRNLVRNVEILCAAVGCLMLIACANIASLLLVRANARLKEMSVRAALGASRYRLIRQLLTENILVALLGGVGGVLLAQWGLEFIRSSIPSGGMNRVAAGGGMGALSVLELDLNVLVFALGLSVATALIFGLAPAWLSSSVDLNEALKQGTRGSTEGRARGRFRGILVVLEIAMAVTLLACSGLLIRSFLRLAEYNPGFDSKGTAFVRVALQGSSYKTPEQQTAFTRELLARIQSLEGVEAAGTTNFFPLSGNYGSLADGFAIEGRPDTTVVAERPVARSLTVSPDYFRAMRIPLERGRVFSVYDDAKARPLAIINRTLARQQFPDQNPIGQRITIANGSEAWREIVGVVGDVGQVAVDEVPPAQVYEPYAQRGGTGIVIVVRARGNPALIPALIKSEVQRLDRNLPVGDINTAANFLYVKLTVQRLTLHLLTTFAAIGLLIAALGIYGVIAFSVSQRTVEIGIRMALGAQNEDVLRLILRQGVWLIGIGFALGIFATFVAGRAIESQLYKTSGNDPVSLVVITLFFAGVAALACWFPARRAMKIDPIVALRAE